MAGQADHKGRLHSLAALSTGSSIKHQRPTYTLSEQSSLQEELNNLALETLHCDHDEAVVLLPIGSLAHRSHSGCHVSPIYTLEMISH
jgi:hypothetical protein